MLIAIANGDHAQIRQGYSASLAEAYVRRWTDLSGIGQQH
jgi:hypothetical protein